MPSSYTIGEHFEALVHDLVQSGRYSSASEVMRDGLRMVEEREQLRQIKIQALRAAIQEGLDSGPAEPWDINEILAEARKRKAARDEA